MSFARWCESTATIQEGIYEILDCASGQYLNTIPGSVYNRCCDDALILQDRPSRLGKWEISSVGQGYTIKQVLSGLYCALADGDQLHTQTVVLSPVPTVWSITYNLNAAEKTVNIGWSISNLYWDTPPSGQARLVSMGKLVNKQKENTHIPMTWRLNATVQPGIYSLRDDSSDGIQPGIYALQNKQSGTYVSLSLDESSVSCWPKEELNKIGVKLWEIMPLGGGYSIRLIGTDKYCTVQPSLARSDAIIVTVAKMPTAWKIELSHSHDMADGKYIRIFWANTQFCWDLANWGDAKPGTPVDIRNNVDYQPCRFFKLIS